jgi:hypothetical protein
MTLPLIPSFPVDDATLDLLEAAINPWVANPDAERSSLHDLLTLFSEMAGSDPKAVAEQLDENTALMRDPVYHEHDVITALIDEIRRLRTP